MAFTVRVDLDKQKRNVYSAMKYRVDREREAEPRGRVIILIDETGNNQIRRIALENDSIAYVMNENGVTIDKILGKMA